MGASFMIILTIPNMPRSIRSSKSISGFARSRKPASETPNSTPNRMIWRMFPRANASTMLVGMMLRKKSRVERCSAEFA